MREIKMREIKRYVVSVGYREFVFEDCDAAIYFANTAAETLVKDESSSFNHVTISIETEEEDDA